MVAAPRRGAVGRRPQPPVARPRRARHRRRAPRGDVRGGRLAHGDGQVRAAPARASSTTAATPARAHRRDAQRGVPAAAARRRARAARAPADGRHGDRPAIAELDPRRLLATFRDLGGHDLGALLDGLPRRPTRSATARPSSSPTRSRAGRCRPRATRPTTRRCSPTSSSPSSPTQLGDRPGRPVGAASTPARPRAELCAAAAARLRARAGRVRARRRRCPPTLGREHTGTRSTQQAFGRLFVDLDARGARGGRAASSPSRPTSAPSTNLGGWINRAGIWSIGDRIDWFADDTDTLVRWRESDHGRHVELGIAEVNLVGLLGELGRDVVARRPAAAAGRHDLRPVRRARARAVVVRHLRRRAVDPRRHAVAASRSGPRAARTSR